MNDGGTFGGADGEPLVRPFLHRGPAGPAEPSAPSTDLRGELRPYLITGGRTAAAAHVAIAMETVVVVPATQNVAPRERIAFERAAVLAECRSPRSVAEVAARLHLPLVVALVLVGDLVGEGLLEASATSAHQSDDVAFLERLIDGVTAL